MANSTDYGSSRKENGNKFSRLLFDGEETKYEIWETTFFRISPYIRFKRYHLRQKTDKERNEEAYAKLIQFLDDNSLSLTIREASNNRREALRILHDHYAGNGKPRIISLYIKLTSLKREPIENVTDYVIRTEAMVTALRNAKESLSDNLIIAMILKRRSDMFNPFSIYVTHSS